MASSIETTSTTTTFKNQNTTYITVDTNNNIGIGTTTPAVNLNVAKSADGVAARFQRTSGGGLVDIETYNGIGGIGTGDNIPFRLNTNNAERVRIDTSGNVGIGTNSPSSYGKLAVYKSSGDVESAVVTGSANYATYRLQNNAQRYSAQIRTDQSNAFVIRDETAGANRFAITTAGNVGINRATPVTKLHIEGGGTSLPATTGTTPSAGTTLRIRPGDNAILDIGGNSATGAWLQSYDQTGMQTEYPLLLNPNGGDVSIGGTAGDLKFNSGYGSAATAYGCRAWVNFNGTGTVAIREDGNVSSITDNSTGNYTVNFAVAMPDVNYGYSLTGRQDGAECNNMCPVRAGFATGSFQFQAYNVDATPGIRDYIDVALSIFR